MKITIEARRNTWVPFLDTKAKLEISWRAKATYRAHNIRDSLTWTANSRYIFKDIKTGDAIPSSQLIIMEDGVPLAITQTVVSGAKDRLQSEDIEDPFVVITDNLANISKSEPARRRVAKGIFERTWTETIVRNVKIENKTGKKVELKLTISDHPADDLVFERAEPAPNTSQPPEHTFERTLEPDAEESLLLTFKLGRREKIEVPVVMQRAKPDQTEAQMIDDFPQEAVEAVDWPDESDDLE